jgi:hypothetical protein
VVRCRPGLQDLEKHYEKHDPLCERFLFYGYEHYYGFGSQ